MHVWALAMLFASGPRFHPGAEGVVERGRPAPASPRAAAQWLPRALGLRPDTDWQGRRIELPHGGWLLIVREHFLGRPIAGARLALRVGPDGRLRQVIGTGLTRTLDLAATPELRDAEARRDATLWWPTDAGLVPARIEESALDWSRGAPRQERRWVDARSGRVLARESTVDEIVVPVRGWEENSLLTPELVDYDVELADFEAILLENDVFRVYQCNWDDQASKCAPEFGPVGNEPADLYLAPPTFEDAAGNAAQDDPHAALQFMQFASRFQTKLVEWGWDPFAWDDLDCGWQDTDDPADCRVEVYVNVLAQDADGVFPYAGAFYRATGQIFMGQGYNADTAYDGDIVIHEIGHHITHSFGSPEPSGMVDDGARLYTDINAINESSSDVFARLMGTNDRIYDYYSELEPGTYVGPRIRDVSIPFRCPENVVGEVHMDGRIWVSAMIDGQKALEDAGLADRDAFASMYLGALAAIRQIPRDQVEQMPQAREIVLDEVELSFGASGRALVEDVLDERRIGMCDYVIDLAAEPSLQGEPDPEDALDARFMVFRSHKPWEDQEVIDAQPFAPPVQHRITLGPDQGGVRLRYWPNLWRPARPVEDVELAVAGLVKAGGELVAFARDPETAAITNDAEQWFFSEPEADGDANAAQLVIDGLTPGETYTIALVSLTPIDGDVLMLEDMRWATLPAPPPGEEGGDTGGSEDTGEGGGAANGDVGGCGCTAGRGPARGLIILLPLLALPRRRRSCTIGADVRARTDGPGADRTDRVRGRLSR